jgi:hypothetical protein
MFFLFNHEEAEKSGVLQVRHKLPYSIWIAWMRRQEVIDGKNETVIKSGKGGLLTLPPYTITGMRVRTGWFTMREHMTRSGIAMASSHKLRTEIKP